MTQPVYPNVNGIQYDFAAVEFVVGSTTITGVKDIKYSHKCEPAMLRGTRAKPQGRTRGNYEAEASATLYMADANFLRETLGDSYMTRSFDIVVHYAELGMPTVTDRVIGCRIKSEANEHQEGNDALVVAFEFSVMEVRLNGIDPITDPPTSST